MLVGEWTAFLFSISGIACFLCLSEKLVIAADDDQYGDVILANILYRHGDRSPIMVYPNDPFSDVRKFWPEGFGQLSSTGKTQHYELGKYMRNRYKDFLPWKYNSSDIYVRSSNIDRCLMSAQCNLLELYPPIKDADNEQPLFQPVPIHTTPKNSDYLIFPYVDCPLYWLDRSLFRMSEEYLCIQNITLHIKETIRNYAGFTEMDLAIHDTLYIENINNLNLPEWTEAFYPEPLKSISLLEVFTSCAATKQLQRLTAGPLVHEMVVNMLKKANRTLDQDRKLFVYSAHDFTISNLLMALSIHNGAVPPYASALFIELRQKDNRHFVLVSYRNTTTHEPYILNLPECDVMCPLEDFVKLTEFLKFDDLHSECNTLPSPAEYVEARIPVHGIPQEWEKCFNNTKSADGRFYIIKYNRPDSIIYAM